MKKFLFFLISSMSISPYFKPTYFWDERYWAIPKEPESDISLKISAGKTSKGRNNDEQIVNVLNIYGNENLYLIAKGVPEDVLNRFPTSILNTLFNEPKNHSLGKMEITGKFQITEITLDAAYMLNNNWFIQAAANLFKFKLTDIVYKDLTQTTDIPSSIGKTNWDAFFSKFPENMEKYEIELPHKKGSETEKEVEFMIGYRNCWDTKYFKSNYQFVGGIAAPMKKAVNINAPLAIGHNLGKIIIYPFSFSFSFEPTKNFLMGTAIGGIFLPTKKIEEVPMKTDEKQNGMIKLATGQAIVNRGNFFTIGSFAQFKWNDRWKLMGSYKYNQEAKTTLTPTNTSIFDTETVNSDSVLNRWEMTVLNLALEYVLEKKNYTFTFAGAINRPIGGKNIFNLTTFELGAAITFHWD